ncbi:MAG TPA: hypothetical protein VK670_03240, partial [Silvibacterium sp.]|nr:hypothetical protein [Silvibacterium sp.]
MHLTHNSKGPRACFIVVCLLVFASLGLHAQKKTSSSPPPKASAPAPKPASSSSPSRPSSGNGSASGAGHTSTAGGATHSGISANGPHTGTANNVSTHHSPMANGTNSTHSATPTTASYHPTANNTTAGNRTTGMPQPKGSQQATLHNGSTLEKRPNGKVSDVHDTRTGMDIHHGLTGSKRVSMERADHSRVVAQTGRPGYIQREFTHNGHDYARRAYYYHGHEYYRYYRGYYYRGAYIHVYTPVYYYPAAFYGWAYGMWYTPVVYPWGWIGSPWYGYYGFYFMPYASYPAASLWLTDYMLSSDLALAYQAQHDAPQQDSDAQGNAGAVGLTPDVKQMIATEVKNQIALENAEAQQNAQNQEPDPESSGVARLLSDGQPHVFVAGGPIDVMDASGTECAITEGDALELTTPPPAGATVADLVVLSSKGGKECRKAETVTVAVDDLQEMQNHMRETIDTGLQELQSKQGQNGLPALPTSAAGAPAEV